jgi:hypothetical protein
MKKVVHIAIIMGLISSTSCKKDEFNESFEQVQSGKESKVFDIHSVNENGSDKVDNEDIIIHVSESDDDIKKKEEDIVIISIKEVSDGDDEADSGDESRKKE